MLPHQVNQPLFAEFAEIIFRFGHAVAVSQEEFALAQRDRSFLITSVVEQADDRAALLQPAHRTVFAQNDRRQVTAVAVGELALAGRRRRPETAWRIFPRACSGRADD